MVEEENVMVEENVTAKQKAAKGDIVHLVGQMTPLGAVVVDTVVMYTEVLAKKDRIVMVELVKIDMGAQDINMVMQVLVDMEEIMVIVMVEIDLVTEGDDMMMQEEIEVADMAEAAMVHPVVLGMTSAATDLKEVAEIGVAEEMEVLVAEGDGLGVEDEVDGLVGEVVEVQVNPSRNSS